MRFSHKKLLVVGSLIIVLVITFLAGGIARRAGVWGKVRENIQMFSFKNTSALLTSIRPEKLIIDIKFKYYQELLKDRKQALDEGLLTEHRKVDLGLCSLGV